MSYITSGGMNPWQQPNAIQFTPSYRTPLTCKCGKPCTYKRLATETKPTRHEGIVIVVKEREAVYCEACGVIAWAS